MRYGITIFATDKTIPIIDLARAAEDRGFNSLWLPEHTHIPVSRRTPAPMGEPLPEEYKRTLDPFVALAAAAVATSSLRVGTGIALVAQRDPIATAKAAATLDLVSDGRLSLGVGFGWNREEMADHAVEYAVRRDVAREHIQAMQRLWQHDQASMQGRYVSFEPTWSWPKPIQQPLPVLVGGAAGPILFQHIAEYGHGWIPIGGHGLTEAIPQLKETVANAGRDPDRLDVVPFGSVPDHGKLDHFAKIGVTECVFRLPSAGAETVLPILDRQAKLIAERS